MKPILILNGPNLNMLGKREPSVYGSDTLADIEQRCTELGQELGVTLEFFQSNEEGALISRLHQAYEANSGVILNAAGYTHTSVALRDAVALLPVPVVEVHLSNVHKREEFRHHSYLSAVSLGVICGFGAEGYLLAIRALHARAKA